MPDKARKADKRDQLLSLSKNLHAVCRDKKLALRLISQQPEEWRIGRFVVAVDRRRDKATVRYARNAIATGLSCDASAIVEACESALARLTKSSLEPDKLLAALASAYRRALESTGGAVGQRIALTEVLAGLRRDTPRYTRAQFAFDLARLRRQRRLTGNGYRIDLGVATGSATSKKRSVVWIEDESGSGQYFMSFRMIPCRPEDA